VAKKRRTSFRKRVETRARQRCEYCRSPQSAYGYRFHLEHIVPLADGGSNDFENRALACAACNLAKCDRTTGGDPESGRLVALFNPRLQTWHAHFRWLSDRQTLVGLTATGRATIVALRLNDEIRMQARQLWFDAGLLP
jgi:5-methylcytosine-specific restriction endonuclease McrA